MDNVSIPFGQVVQVGLVSSNMRETMDGLVAAGIGPWRILEFGPHNSQIEYLGEPTDCSLRAAVARQGSMTWEVIEPTGGGRNPYSDFLEQGVSGFHHVAIAGDDIPFDDRVEQFRRAGYREVFFGSAYGGKSRFAYYQGLASGSPLIEIFDIAPGFDPPVVGGYPEN